MITRTRRNVKRGKRAVNTTFVVAQNATAARAAGYGDADYSLIWFTTYYPDELARDSQCAHNVWHNLLILLMAPAHYYWFRAAPRSDGRWFIPVVIAPMLNRPRTRSRERAQCDDARAFSFPEHAVPRCKHRRAFRLCVCVCICIYVCACVATSAEIFRAEIYSLNSGILARIQWSGWNLHFYTCSLSIFRVSIQLYLIRFWRADVRGDLMKYSRCIYV